MFSFFTIDKEPFLAALSTDHAQCNIYKWKHNAFVKTQETAFQCFLHLAFVINNESYLVLSNRFSKSIVYRWSGKNFSKLQTLHGSTFSLRFLYDNDHMFLALGSRKNSNYLLHIYKWNGIEFMLFHSIPTLGLVSGLHSFVMCGQTLLGLTEWYNTNNSTLYLFSYGKPTKYQEISTFEANDMTSFEYNGHTYLAIANLGNQRSTKNSALYKSTKRIFITWFNYWISSRSETECECTWNWNITAGSRKASVWPKNVRISLNRAIMQGTSCSNRSLTLRLIYNDNLVKMYKCQ